MAVGRDAKATFTAIVKGDASQAVTEFKKFGDTVQRSTMQASTATGRWSASLQSAKASATSFITSGYGMAAVAGVAATAIWKSVSAASDLALEVGRLSDATGLSTDAASRWVEVGGDIGMTADQLAGLIEKMTKNLGAAPEKFERLGISVQRTDEGAADMNATLLLAIGRLNEIKDPTERAALAQQLFGRSWAEAAELISMSSTELADRLGAVADEKIINEDDIDDAREFRDALDDLGDILEELMVEVGQHVIPVLADFAKALNSTIGVIKDVNGAIDTATGGVLDMRYAVAGLAAGPLGIAAVGLWDLHDAAGDFGDTIKEWVQTQLDRQVMAEAEAYADAVAELDAYNERMAEAARLKDEAAAASWRLYDSELALLGVSLDVEGAQSTYLGSLDRLAKAIDDPTTLVDEHAEALTRAKGAALAVAAAVVEQARLQAEANGTTLTATTATDLSVDALGDLAAQLAPGSELRMALEAYAGELADIPRVVTTLELRTTTVPVRGKDGSVADVPYYLANPKNVVYGRPDGRAAGGPAGGRTWVGERGPELVDLPAGSWVHNAGQSSAMVRRAAGSGSAGATNGAPVVHINVAVNATPATDRARLGREMIDAINAAYASGVARLAAA